MRKTAAPEMEKQAACIAEPVYNDGMEQQADSFEQIELDVFMMESEADSVFVLMPGLGATAGAAATAVAVCATCRMLLEQCECGERKPRQPAPAPKARRSSARTFRRCARSTAPWAGRERMR